MFTAEPLKRFLNSTVLIRNRKVACGVQSVHFPARKRAGDKTLNCRYELKYRIPEFKARAIANFVRFYIKADKYSLAFEGMQYPISSLYLDSEGLSLCRETIEGKKNRFKLRIRSYSDNPDSPCFFEIKRRINNVIVKGRARADRNDIANVLSNGLPSKKIYREDLSLLKQFQLYRNSLGARPMVLVRYDREAYEGDSLNRVRITFDRNLHYKTTSRPEVEVYGSNWHRIALNFVVLEIKFTQRFPAWLVDMVKCFDLKQGAFSKYVSSIKQSNSVGFSAPEILVQP